MKDELWLEATDSIAATMEKIGEPLSSAQKIVLSGALAIWIEKAAKIQKLNDALICDKCPKRGEQ